MDRDTLAVLALIAVAGLIILGFIGVGKLFSLLGKRSNRNFFRGNLREDYIRNNPDLARNGKVACHCGNTRILLRNLERNGSNVVREHVCDQCGTRLYYSASGEYYEGILRELRKETGLVTEPMPVQSK